MMSGSKGKKCTFVIRRLILCVLLTNIMLVLYCLTNTAKQVNIRESRDEDVDNVEAEVMYNSDSDKDYILEPSGDDDEDDGDGIQPSRHQAQTGRHNTGVLSAVDRTSQQDMCPQSMAKALKNNVSIPSQSTKSDGCSPTVNIMFMKTHKTASSTILNILFRFGEKHKLKFAFPDGRNDFFYPSPFLCSQVKDYRPGDCFNIVCNHMRFDHQEVAKLLPPEAVYITIVRDPVDLFESSFHYYHRAVPLTWRINGENKLAEFLNNPQAFYSPEAFNSFYLKNMLFFDFGFDNNLEADDPRVMTHIHDLSKRFHLVLVAEYFEESLILLKDILCWTIEDILYFKLNARRSSSVSRLTPELRAKALQWNGADWRLYQHFNASFWARVEAYGRERMKLELNELRKRNAEMKAICIEDGGAVEAQKIQDRRFLPWQPVGESSIMGYNVKKNIDPRFRTTCEKMLTPEIQYLSDLGVSLWLTRLWGWLKDAVFTV